MTNAHAAKMQAKAVADLAEQHKCHDELLHEINAKLDAIFARLDDAPTEPAGGGPLKNRVHGK